MSIFFNATPIVERHVARLRKVCGEDLTLSEKQRGVYFRPLTNTFEGHLEQQVAPAVPSFKIQSQDTGRWPLHHSDFLGFIVYATCHH
jgi:hypothetical protein